MMRIHRPVAVLAAATALGCGSKPGTPPTAAVPGAPTAGDSGATPDPRPTLASPEYANWKKYPVGTVVKRRREATNPKEPGKKTVETTTLKLFELTDRRAVVESQVTVEKTGYDTDVKPAQKLDYPASFPLPAGMSEAEFGKFLLPDPKAKVAGTETVRLLGQEYTATVYEWVGSLESGPMPIKLWVSDDMPGRLVKSEFTIDKAGSKALEEVIEVKAP